ncbi:MAG TPA: hypothetical protein PKL69_13830 [Agitococcus sp.]|nr:hypothetical protein [Agitococcus sp.]HMX99155.1 hypothetical protein [Agitococcus sp.]HNA21253.1 hypothetical protein [Agitococcus sp.]HNC02552.1 hypothetical protein [Agitococcus sp.]HNI62371.1 hypothetical protein [Agitococcus sp.]
MNKTDFICTEEQMRKLDVLDAHLHVLSALSSAITRNDYPLDLSADKLATLLYTLSNDLTEALSNIKLHTHHQKKEHSHDD